MFKPLLNSALLTLAIVFGQTVVAAEDTATKPAPKMQREHKMMGGDMDHDKMVKHLQMEQEHRLKIHDLSNKILAEKDAKKQEELKHQQFELMMEHHMHKMKMHHQMMQKHQKQQ